MKSLHSEKDCLYVLPDFGSVHVSAGDNLMEDVLVDAILNLTLPSVVLYEPKTAIEEASIETTPEIVKPKPTKK